MKRVDLYEMFKTPATHQPPDVSALTNNSMYPNMNSIEYRNKSILYQKFAPKLLPFFETFDVNDNGTVICGANTYTDRVWTGALYGYNKFTDIDGNKNGKELFVLNYTSSVTKLLFLEPSMILVADANGAIQMWSTQSPVRNESGYSLFDISKKSEHIGLILAMDITSNRKKAITGSSDCCLKIWTIGPCDLVSDKTYRYAHGDAITEIANKPSSDFCFLTSSRDKSISLWDYRLQLPVVDCHDGEFGYSTVSWATNHTQLLAGNERGDVHIFDSRNLKSILKQVKGFSNKPVHKIKTNPNNDNLVAVLGQSNVVKVFDIKNDFKLIYENDSANDYVRDVHWCRDNSNTFYSIGWNKQSGIHKVDL